MSFTEEIHSEKGQVLGIGRVFDLPLRVTYPNFRAAVLGRQEVIRVLEQ